MVAVASLAADAQTLDKRALVVDLHLDHGVPVADVCEEFDVAPSTAYRWISAAVLDRVPDPREFAVRIDHRLCSHKPIVRGEATVCCECTKSGFDHRPEMKARPLPKDRRKPRDDDGLRGGK